MKTTTAVLICAIAFVLAFVGLRSMITFEIAYALFKIKYFGVYYL